MTSPAAHLDPATLARIDALSDMATDLLESAFTESRIRGAVNWDMITRYVEDLARLDASMIDSRYPAVTGAETLGVICKARGTDEQGRARRCSAHAFSHHGDQGASHFDRHGLWMASEVTPVMV